jgi:hypothetical protein
MFKLLIILANGRWDLTRHLKGYAKKSAYVLISHTVLQLQTKINLKADCPLGKLSSPVAALLYTKR